jgi:hypothetical protein
LRFCTSASLSCQIMTVKKWSQLGKWYDEDRQQ